MGRFTRDATGRHECPHPQCDAEISNYIYACRQHWFELPVDIRQAITTAWRRVGLGDSAGIAAHGAATAAAVDYWHDRIQMRGHANNLEWARNRALYYVTQGRTSPANALASIISDLTKFDPPLLDDNALAELNAAAWPLVEAGDTAGMRALLERIV